MFRSPGPVIFDLGELLNLNFSLELRWYGLMIGLGFLLGVWIIWRLSRPLFQEKYRHLLLDWALVSFLGGLIGARLWFVALQWDYFSSHYNEIWAIWEGGQSIQGGIIGGIIFSWVYYRLMHRHLPSWLRMLDIAAIALPVSQAIGRIGNFFNSEAFGMPTSLPWGFFVPEGLRPVEFLGYQYFHPTFFYEAIFLLICAGVLYWMYRRFDWGPGVLICAYLFLYSFGRYFLEFLRLDSLHLYGMPAAQLVAIATMFITGLMIFILAHKKR